MLKPDQSQFDRAREWVNENYPDLDGEEWQTLVNETAEELAESDDLDDDACHARYGDFY